MIHSSFPRLAFFAAMAPRGNMKTAKNSDSQKLNSKFPWGKTASIGTNGEVSIESINPMERIGDRGYDISQSADWMEYLEQKEGRQGDEGGAGAYDTLRCDVVISSPKHEMTYKPTTIVWGEKFHLDRLRNSYTELLKARTKDALDPSGNDFQASLEKALQESHRTLHQLLSSAESEARCMHNEGEANSNKITVGQLVRITILWSPPTQSKEDPIIEILVRGHACSSTKAVIPNESPEPIVASIAVHTTKDGNSGRATIDKSLPTRYASPQNKIASWCRLRRQMETNSYKAPGIEEVLMVRQVKDEHGVERLEILEGLSSNFFVIYKGGTMRTAIDGCLHGYVRHLVLDSLDQCGLVFDPRPIFLHESSQWHEAFITSSSRLICPISKIIIPEGESASKEESTFQEFWRDQALAAGVSSDGVSSDEGLKQPRWRRLLNAMLKAKGFDDSPE
jgi:branched-subunit amino acid aminotransferase/4-amino-4-deoxychorismate lyase